MAISLLKVLLAVLSLASTKAADPISYPGKTCTLNRDCEILTTGLTCNTAKYSCECPPPTVFYYSVLNRCVLPVNTPCTGSPTEVLTPNSKCDNWVACEDGFVFNPKGRCVVPYNGPCTRDDHCDEDKFQICDTASNKCGCNFDMEANAENICQVKLDYPCRPSRTFPIPSCQELASCTRSQCMCNAGLEGNAKRQCRVPHGGDCSQESDAPCDETNFLECDASTKKCRCNGEGTITWYNPRSQKCELFAGSTCIYGEQRCTEFAECDAGVCSCVPDFFVSPRKRCVHFTCDSCEASK